MKQHPVLQYDNICLRQISVNDIDLYYQRLFVECDEEVSALTGTNQQFTKEQIASYVKRIIDDLSRYDFLIYVDDDLVGEAVINEINGNNAGFRIALSSIANCNQKIGQKAISLVMNYAFECLRLDVIELEVITVNERAYHVYQKIGFQVKKRLKNSYEYHGELVDAYVMQLEKERFKSVL